VATTDEFLIIKEADLAGVPAPPLSESERRILAQSGLPGTEQYGAGQSQGGRARWALTRTLSGIRSDDTPISTES